MLCHKHLRYSNMLLSCQNQMTNTFWLLTQSNTGPVLWNSPGVSHLEICFEKIESLESVHPGALAPGAAALAGGGGGKRVAHSSPKLPGSSSLRNGTVCALLICFLILPAKEDSGSQMLQLIVEWLNGRQSSPAQRCNTSCNAIYPHMNIWFLVSPVPAG